MSGIRPREMLEQMKWWETRQTNKRPRKKRRKKCLRVSISVAKSRSVFLELLIISFPFSPSLSSCPILVPLSTWNIDEIRALFLSLNFCRLTHKQCQITIGLSTYRFVFDGALCFVSSHFFLAFARPKTRISSLLFLCVLCARIIHLIVPLAKYDWESEKEKRKKLEEKAFVSNS